MSDFKEQRERLLKQPKNIENLLDYMRASADMGQIYDYLKEWKAELQERNNKGEWVSVKKMIGDV